MLKSMKWPGPSLINVPLTLFSLHKDFFMSLGADLSLTIEPLVYSFS